jgi:DNA-binding IclR family transcriptional regulator
VISIALRRFILTSIPSVPFLEAALLFQQQPKRPRGADDLAAALYIPRAKATELLEALQSAGIIAASSGGNAYTFAPRDAELASMLVELAGAYRTDMIDVTRLIHDATQRSAQRFADAFKLRKDP